MNTIEAFSRGEASKDKELMVFDWVQAAVHILEKRPEVVLAGLRDDWEWTGGRIFENGKPVPKEDTYTYLASTWAVPEIDLDGEVIACYLMGSETVWDADTYWPPEALKVLEAL